jgi:uncharacterized coiled-coil protein SlyX
LDRQLAEIRQTQEQGLTELNRELAEIRQTQQQGLTELNRELAETRQTQQQGLTELNRELAEIRQTQQQGLTELNRELAKLQGRLDDLASVSFSLSPVGEAKNPPNNTLWEAECQDGMRAISGICVPITTSEALEAAGLDPLNEAIWSCTWKSSMPRARVHALCMTVRKSP